MLASGPPAVAQPAAPSSVLPTGGGPSRRESLAEHAKLDEVIRAIGAARNELIRIEEQPEEEIEAKRDGA
jgi:hypothetical protein